MTKNKSSSLFNLHKEVKLYSTLSGVFNPNQRQDTKGEGS